VEESTRLTSVFLSYSWKDKKVADQIDSDLTQLQIDVVRDVRDVRYKDSISDFMGRIRTTDFAILLISDSYLKSQFCMTEVLHLLREREFEKKILPVTTGDPHIYDPKGRLGYTAYWKAKKDELENELANHGAASVISAIGDLKVVGSIHADINEFIGYVSGVKHLTFEELKKEGYRTLLEAVGFSDITHLVELQIISSEKDIDKREAMLDDWFERHKATSDAYAVRAQTARFRSQFGRAEKNFRRALEMNPRNAFAMNNYGYMLFILDRDHDKARGLFERAIEIMPRLTEARLNLGCLLSRSFKDREGAREQYEIILSYDPAEARAYNNLANNLKEYRLFSKETAEKVCALYEKALELDPGYSDARLAYANFLSDVVGDFDKAETQLRELGATEPAAAEIVSLMLERNCQLRKRGRRKFPRNEPCPCGSGLKYKKCCYP